MVGDEPRSLVCNLNVPLVQKNIDLCLFRLLPEQLGADTYGVAANYVALGELKGGIDPAGADEHWKTARTALVRINEGFAGTGVPIETVFIGAAIVNSMANEIWGMLEARTLHNAANLTNDDQLASIVRWLTAL
jgi:type II restriction enzyme